MAAWVTLRQIRSLHDPQNAPAVTHYYLTFISDRSRRHVHMYVPMSPRRTRLGLSTQPLASLPEESS